MSLRFENFKSSFSADVLKRGRDYYRNHHIRDLSYDDEDTWTAQVEGSEVYDVEIARQPDGSLNCSCTCPYAEMDICKHMAAVLYAIEADFAEVIGKKKPSSGKKKPTKKETLRQALEAIPHADLIKLLLDWAEVERTITDQLLLRLGAKGDKPDDYVAMVKAALRVGKGDYGFVDSQGANRIARQLDLIIAQGNEKHREGQIRVAIAIFQAVLDTVIASLESMELTNNLYGTLHDALEGLRRCGSDLAPAERRRILEILVKYAQDEYFGVIEWDVGPFQMAADLVTTPEDQDFLLTAIKTTSNKYLYALYPEEYVAGIELRIIKRLGKDDDVERFIQSHINLDSFRIELINRAIAAKDFEAAKRHIQEGQLKAASSPRMSMYLSMYKVLALEVAKQQNDKPEIMKLARQLWLMGYRKEEYHLLKTVVAPEKWPAYVDDLLKEVKHPEIQAWIYNEEKRWQDLFTVVKRQPAYILSTYQTTLEQHFPDEMIKFYETTVFDVLRDASSRQTYKAACDLLKRMQQLGDEERVNEIVQLLKAEYPRRKALMEELTQL